MQSNRYRLLSVSAPERPLASALFSLATQVVGAALTATLTLFLARELAPNNFGALTLALSVLSIASLFADFGLTAASGRFLAEHRGDPETLSATFRRATALKRAVSAVAALSLFGLADPITAALGAHLALWPLRVFAVALYAESLVAYYFGAFTAVGRQRNNLVVAAAESVTEFTFAVTAVVLGAGAVGAAGGRALGYMVALGVAVAFGRYHFRRLRLPNGKAKAAVASRRAIVGYATPLLLIEAAFRLFGSIDILLIAALIGSGKPVGEFAVALRSTLVLEYPAAAIAAAVAPRFAAAAERPVALTLFASALRYLALIQLPLAAVVLVWATPLLHLFFGVKYLQAAPTLRALVPFIILSGVAQPVTLAVNYLGRARQRVPIAVGMVALNGVIDALLLPRIGIAGGAVGTDLAYGLWVPAHLFILRRAVGIKAPGIGRTCLRAGLASAATALTLFAFGTGNLSLGTLFLGAFVAALVYLVALVGLREVTWAELAGAGARARSRVAAALALRRL